LPNPIIEILGAGGSARVSASGPLVDVCDEARSPVVFSCRSSTCGTCRVEVLAGVDLLEPPHDHEADALRRLAEPGAPLPQRLACQAVVRAGPGLLRLRWLGVKA
jgi:ferredoxin